jgi:hypothetical protein
MGKVAINEVDPKSKKYYNYLVKNGVNVAPSYE